MARRLIATLQKKQQAPKTIKNVLGSLHSIFDDALRNGWVVENPCRLVEKPDMSTVPMELHLLARVTTCTTPWVEGALTPA